MRLTLRNLLAYLDGILEPQDAHDLSKKIEESKFASDLLHRIRDLMRRLRLPAPSISDRGPGLDPNTVAEYLDNTLPSERVTDFEKVCLEANTSMADIHLAEVAACHQVLTIVLGEPAEIDPALRDRIYRLPEQAKEQEPATTARNAHLPPPIPANPPPETTEPQDFLLYKSRAKPTVPEYLREPRKKRSWFTISTSILTTVCVLLVLLLLARPYDPESALGSRLVRWGIVAPGKEIAKNDDSSIPKNKASSKAKSEDAGKGSKAPLENSQTPPISPENQENAKTPSTAIPGGENPIVPQFPPNGENIPGNENTAQPVVPTTINSPPTVPQGVTPTTVPNQDAPSGGTAVSSEKTAPESVPNTQGTGDVSKIPVPPPVEPAANPQKPMGRFTSNDQILLRSNGNLGNWERLSSGTLLFPQQHLLALPTYRPAITLSSGLILQMLGGTELELLPGDAQIPSGIKIDYGRIVITSVANPGTKLKLVIGDQAYLLTFLDPESNVGIEVRGIHTLGTNPESEAGRIMTEIFVTKDRIAWEENGAKPLEIAAPAHILLLPQIPSVTDHSRDFPKWITTPESIGDLDRRASQFMLQSFTPELPAQQKLLELADPSQTRLAEVRRLAVRCLGYLNYFDPMVTALNDPAYKGEWYDKQVEWLREAVKRDPQTAAAVRETFEKHFQPQAANLYRMLWGYTDKDLAAGEDAKLVKNLDDDNLAVRVLAICNLKMITDKDLGYKPEGRLPERARGVRLWQQRLEGKEVRAKQTDKKNGPANPTPPPTIPDGTPS